VHTPEPLGRGAGWLGRACGEAGWAEPRIRPKSRIQIRNIFPFQNYFINYKSILNFNDFYSHNKIQEHFITPRKNMQQYECNK
jgi:hypothetical protein